MVTMPFFFLLLTFALLSWDVLLLEHPMTNIYFSAYESSFYSDNVNAIQMAAVLNFHVH